MIDNNNNNDNDDHKGTYSFNNLLADILSYPFFFFFFFFAFSRSSCSFRLQTNHKFYPREEIGKRAVDPKKKNCRFISMLYSRLVQ